MMAALRVETIVSDLFSQNAFVVWRTGSPAALIIDPGFDPDSILDVIHRERLVPVAIVNTHGHADHIAGNHAMRAAFPDIPLVIGRNEAHLLTDAEANLSAAFGMPVLSPPADRLVDDGERLELAGIEFLVREIPGHSPGSVVYIADREVPPVVLVGDVIFAGSVGRHDFPGGSAKTLLSGIREKLLVLPEESVLYPGHGPATTIGREKATNPFVGRGTS